MRAKRTGVVLLAAVALAGCGSSGDTSGLTSGQRAGLMRQLEAVRSSAAAGNVGGAQDALDRFRRAILHLRRTGALDDAQARALRIGAARVLARVRSDNPPRVAPVATQTTPAPAPVPPPKPQHRKDHQHKEHGKGHGKDKGEGGD